MYRVLIVENERLLGAGVENLISRDTSIKVIGIEVHHETEMVAAIKQFQPDMVVLDKGTLLTNPPRLLELLGDFPKLRIMAVSANDNRVYIYNRRLILVKYADDLVDLIHAELTQTN